MAHPGELTFLLEYQSTQSRVRTVMDFATISLVFPLISVRISFSFILPVQPVKRVLSPCHPLSLPPPVLFYPSSKGASGVKSVIYEVLNSAEVHEIYCCMIYLKDLFI